MCEACERDVVIDDIAVCVDCGVNTKLIGDYYMVRPHIWGLWGVGDRMLCIPCFEDRLGRHLVASDFTEAICNHYDVVVLRSQTMLNRLATH